MKKLTKEQIKMLHSALVERFGGQDGLRDEGMLDSLLTLRSRPSPAANFIPTCYPKLRGSLSDLSPIIRSSTGTSVSALTQCWYFSGSTMSRSNMMTMI